MRWKQNSSQQNEDIFATRCLFLPNPLTERETKLQTNFFEVTQEDKLSLRVSNNGLLESK